MARKFEVGSGKPFQPVAKRPARALPAVKPRPLYGTYRSATPCGVCGVTSSVSSRGYCPPHNEEYEAFEKLLGMGVGTNGQLFRMYRDLLTRISVLEDALEIKRIKEMYE